MTARQLKSPKMLSAGSEDRIFRIKGFSGFAVCLFELVSEMVVVKKAVIRNLRFDNF